MTDPERRVLMISGRSDVGGGPRYIHDVSVSLPEVVAVAWPTTGVFARRLHEAAPDINQWSIGYRKVSLRDIVTLRRKVSRSKVNVVHGHGTSGSLIARIVCLGLNAACVVSYHGVFPAPGPRWMLRRSIESLTRSTVDQWVFVSASEQETASDAFRLPVGRCAVVVNGVPHTPFEAVRASRVDKRVGFVGRMVTQKDPILAASIACAILDGPSGQTYEFHFVGDGPLRREAERMLQRFIRDGRVIFHGEMSDARPFISGLDVLLMTSQAEGLPLTALEAMSFGVPVVATNVPGLSDVASAAPGACYLFAHGDVVGGSRLIENFAHNTTWEDASRMALVASREHFSLEGTVERLAAIYASVVQP